MNESRLARHRKMIEDLQKAVEDKRGHGGTCGICGFHGHETDKCPMSPLNIIDRLLLMETVYRANIAEMKEWQFTTEV